MNGFCKSPGNCLSADQFNFFLSQTYSMIKAGAVTFSSNAGNFDSSDIAGAIARIWMADILKGYDQIFFENILKNRKGC